VKPPHVTSLLSFNGGFVDTASFLGLQGLFAAHVTGNFVTLGAALVFGTHGVIAKLMALPEFAAMIALAHVVGRLLAERPPRALRVLLGAKVFLLVAFFVLAVTLGPFGDSDTPAALLTGFMGIGAMAVQNAVQRVHFGALPPSTIMTGNTTQAVLDAVDLLWEGAEQTAVIRRRFGRLVTALLYFAAGCAIAALLYAWLGFWSLALPVIVGAATSLMRIET
jgi:uncharacterized membrane protein YoaK (UPF0700 family)